MIGPHLMVAHRLAQVVYTHESALILVAWKTKSKSNLAELPEFTWNGAYADIIALSFIFGVRRVTNEVLCLEI